MMLPTLPLSRRSARTVALLILTFAGAARGAPRPDVVLHAEQSAGRALGLRVEPIEARGGAAAGEGASLVGRIITADLRNSGYFRVSGPLAGAASDTVPATFVITGELEGDPPERGGGAAPALTLRLQTLPGRELVLGKRYAPARDQLRATAHHFADQVVQLLTGEPGIALSRIVFSRGRGDRRDLWVVDYDGENLVRLTANRTLNLCPSWSPDGGRIAFTSYSDGQQGAYLLDTATGRVRLVIATPGLNLGPVWRPDGQELLLSLSKDGNPEIYRIDLAGQIVRRLTVSPAIEISPDWSPNGRDIVFTSDRTGTPQLYVMDGDGAGRNRLTFEGDYNDSGMWSPNGEQIVYVTRTGTRTFLVLIAASGENRRLLTDDGWRHAEDPSWAPDGRHVVFASDRSGATKLYVMDVVDGAWRQLTFGNEPDITPAWSR
ncbi:MAG: hypothetical protein ACYDIE_06800 [Candidatus Krumholzibacteriia bacterium]